MKQFMRARRRAVGHAVSGIRYLVSDEIHARIHVVATLLVILLAVTLSLPVVQWCLLALAIGFVWSAEALNTAVERVVDLVTEDENETARQAKDLAAGGVLFSAATAAIVGLIVFVPAILKRLNA